MVGRYYFAIVGREDEALFDFEYSTNKGNEQKLALNPFFDRAKPISSPSFTKKMQRLTSKHFG
ncbi:hypothetical protein CSKR_108096 [Clonorchis sinensis]|uniref:Mbp-1 interacting protein-2a n=2 Tax=Clonorchis sinensis TaxID=79923 RepID=G7Y6Q8_CLOSI|nr:hypothetical protein CSKR_108096 [Clonorchis sinensis]GAA48643.1 mbp-1 interacting protein-2a [Clonorchis sinensis]